jgi:cell division septum initiation protein DivIVA
MARRENPNTEIAETKTMVRRRVVDFDVQQELVQLQELIYESFHIPVSPWTVIDEGKILDQIELISDNLPEAIQKALAVLDQEEAIMRQAEEYAQRIIQSAQQQAAKILDESGIIQQAEQQAAQVRYQVQQECESVQRQTLGELEQIRQVTTQELQQYRQQTVRECQDIQRDADNYADTVLGRLEQELGEMIRVVHNGRQRLYDNSPNHNPNSNNIIQNKPPTAIAPPVADRSRKRSSR